MTNQEPQADICDLLDDYLAGGLSDDQQVRFEAHLGACPRCAAEQRRQQRIDHLVRRATVASTPVPADLAARSAVFIQRRRRVAAWRWVGGAAAAALLLAVTMLAWRVAAPPIAAPLQIAEEQTPVEPPPPRARVTMAPDSRMLAVPIATKRAEVTIVWCYPIYEPRRPPTDDLPGGLPGTDAQLN